MDDRNRQKKKFNPGIFIVIILLSLFSDAGSDIIGTLLFAVLGLMCILAPVLLIWFIVRRNKQGKSKTGNHASFDDCPKPVCFHRDKGEHHVRKGREMDPWDRPDIDISKYQRKQ